MSSLLGTAQTPSVRKPAIEVRFGSAAANVWARALSFVTVELGAAPAVDAVQIAIAPGQHAPAVAVGDTGTVSLGFAGALVQVFSGTVASVLHSVSGATRIVATNAGGTLARLRVNQSYEQLSAGRIVSELASGAGLNVTAADGISFPYYVVDDSRSAWAQVATLARTSGFFATVDGQGSLVFGPSQTTPAKKFGYGVDILALQAAESAPLSGKVTVVGEGAAGSQGSDAWSWLIKDAAAVTASAGSGKPERLAQEPSLRSKSAAQSAADGASARAKSLAVAGRLVVPGTPEVVPAGSIEIERAPDASLNGVRTVGAVRHRFAKGVGFVTTIDFGRTP